MGFHIPDSPPRRAVSSTASQTTTDATHTSDSDAATFRQRFSARRRNALVPTLFIDVVGSPRSPFVCLSRSHRLALSRQRLREQAQQTTPAFAVGTDCQAAGGGMCSDSSCSRSTQQAKRAPSVGRRADQQRHYDAVAPSRAALNVYEIP
ncbi:hypothetical protein PybrP1_002395 [[Pythium] brassicae (nom. inval.)]|nr:hypothetical protein PybrP1_002395 [[Pythium] brassicae (nom. inval.)]